MSYLRKLYVSEPIILSDCRPVLCVLHMVIDAVWCIAKVFETSNETQDMSVHLWYNAASIKNCTMLASKPAGLPFYDAKPFLIIQCRLHMTRQSYGEISVCGTAGRLETKCLQGAVSASARQTFLKRDKCT